MLDNEKPECCTELDLHRDLTPGESQALANLQVISAHQALMSDESKAKDARANAADAKAEEENR